MKAVLVAVCVLVTAANTALAGGYRYYRPVVTKVIRQQDVFIEQPDVFVIQNNNPAPLVAQGDTSFRSGSAYGGVQQSVLPFFDPNPYLRQSLALVQAANETASQQFQRTSALADKIAASQSLAVEIQSRGQAAEAILRAAGLPTVGQSNQSTFGVVITRDLNGNVQVTQLAEDQATQYAEQQYTPSPQRDNTPSPPNTRSLALTTQFCGKCHAESLASPKGAFYLGTSNRVVQVMRQSYSEIQSALQGNMPPAGEPQPTADQRQQILAEISSITGAVQ